MLDRRVNFGMLAMAAVLTAWGYGTRSGAGTLEPEPDTAAVSGLAADAASALLAPPALEIVDPAREGLDPARLAEAEAAVRREVRRGSMPGAVLVVGRGDKVVAREGIGTTVPSGTPTDPAATLYDLASLTKVVATTTAVMLLVEDGAMELDAPVSRYLPEFSGGAKDAVTIRHLLTHTSGLPAGAPASGVSPDAVLRRLVATPLRWAPGQRVVYSDAGPIVLWAALERAAGESPDRLLERRVFAPLGMTSTRFAPALPCTECAPTSPSLAPGRVHDPLSRRLGGVAGNAGLFSTGLDMGRFAAMLAGGGELDGVRVLQEETIRTFARRQPGAGTRALGWDTPNPRGRGAAGRRISPAAFGHTGFTGTSIWVDPDRRTWTVLLANRTYRPRAPNRMQALRRTVHDRVSEAADLYLGD